MSAEPVKPIGVVGPLGETLTLKKLPAAGARERWTDKRKAQVVSAVRGNLITKEEACKLWRISAEEFARWETLYDQHGIRALRAKSLQRYRNASDRAANGSRDPEAGHTLHCPKSSDNTAR